MTSLLHHKNFCELSHLEKEEKKRGDLSRSKIMARLWFLAFVVLSCAFATVVLTKPTFTVVGKVYCDTCRIGFETKATQYMEGAKVKLECRHFLGGKVEHTVPGVTDKNGAYIIELADNHENEICEVVLVESSMKDCAELVPGRDRARVVLSNDIGISADVRYANALGYNRTVPLDVCKEVTKMYILDDDE
ncbi:Pollen Ole e 1 allergen and extensin family protein [Rhynchospora pubera]|uniref:Pollen Ole e 1 allergen and extensin family protein n=1 Tax=Rhynchospora pubera TaxID=906938 RepID=A0AAV8FP12_9POAL|nr:Pollen Ole e 1 allergen and extensin family protein [Rhynchospora pubera]